MPVDGMDLCTLHTLYVCIVHVHTVQNIQHKVMFYVLHVYLLS